MPPVSLYECMDDRVNEDSDNITDYLQVRPYLGPI